MKTIERYVSGSCLSAFLLAWLVLTFVLSVGLLVKVTSLIAKGMSVAIVGRYLLTAIPETLGFTIPLAILVAALLVFGRLSADSEIAAMRACGVDLLQIMRAPLGFALAMSLLCLYLNNEVTPRNDRRLDLLRAQASADLGLDAMEPGKFNDGPGGLAICFARRQGDWLYDVLIFGRATNGVEREVRAARARIVEQGDDLQLDFYDVWIDPFADDRPGAANAARFSYTVAGAFRPANRPRKLRNDGFRELLVHLREARAMASDPRAAARIVAACPSCRPEDPRREPPCTDPVHRLARDWIRAAPLSEPEMHAALLRQCPHCRAGACDDPNHARVRRAAEKRRELLGLPEQVRVELHKRLAFASAAFFFALIGMPLGIRAHRRESTVGVAVGLGIALAFYLAMILADALARHPGLQPHLICWIPVALCTAAAAILIPRNQ
jgi:lipopolysaccharide export system permease protein